MGTVAIATPAVVNKLPKSLESYKVSDKVQCHGKKAFALVVGNEVKVWSASEEELRQPNNNEHKGSGYIIPWDGSACQSR